MDKFKALVAAFTANLSFLLVFLALISFTYAGFLVDLVAGFIILGFALVVLAYILAPDSEGGE